MFKPLVSINIPIYNGELFLKKTLLSALAQSYTNYEIILIIDGTKDHSEAIIQELQATFPEKIRYKWQENQGLAKTRNELINMSRGEYIALLDQDDLWLPHKLEKQMQLFEKDPAVGLVFSDCAYIDGQEKVTGTYPHKLHRGNVFNELFENYFIACPSMIFKKDVIKRAGLFDTRYRYAEEAAFALKVALFYKLDYVPEVTCYYRMHGENTSQDQALLAAENYRFKKDIYAFAKEHQHHANLSNTLLIKRELRRLLLAHMRAQLIKLAKILLKPILKGKKV